MPVRAAAMLVLFSGLACGPAAATGTINCLIADKNLTLTFEGIYSQGLGEGLARVRGEAQPNLKGLSPGFGPFALAQAHVTQFWLEGGALKLRRYRESESVPREALELVMETRQEGRDPNSYSGTYRGIIRHFETLTGPEGRETAFGGRVDCQTDRTRI